MSNDHFRYFIVLPPEKTATGAVSLQSEARRQVAMEFVNLLREWVVENGQQDLISDLNVTMLGQIQITCHPSFIEQIRRQDVLAIAEIRPVQNISRLLDQVSR
jgi:hypothetical protein